MIVQSFLLFGFVGGMANISQVKTDILWNSYTGSKPRSWPFDLKVTSKIVDWMLVMVDQGTVEKNRNGEECMNLFE